jgi:hypothetical protein
VNNAERVASLEALLVRIQKNANQPRVSWRAGASPAMAAAPAAAMPAPVQPVPVRKATPPQFPATTERVSQPTPAAQRPSVPEARPSPRVPAAARPIAPAAAQPARPVQMKSTALGLGRLPASQDRTSPTPKAPAVAEKPAARTDGVAVSPVIDVAPSAFEAAAAELPADVTQPMDRAAMLEQAAQAERVEAPAPAAEPPVAALVAELPPPPPAVIEEAPTVITPPRDDLEAAFTDPSPHAPTIEAPPPQPQPAPEPVRPAASAATGNGAPAAAEPPPAFSAGPAVAEAPSKFVEPIEIPKKKRGGLGLALFALLVIAGGAAAFAYLQSQNQRAPEKPREEKAVPTSTAAATSTATATATATAAPTETPSAEPTASTSASAAPETPPADGPPKDPASLPATMAYLQVKAPETADVFVDGQKVGSVGDYIEISCTRRNRVVALRQNNVAKTRGKLAALVCQKALTVEFDDKEWGNLPAPPPPGGGGGTPPAPGTGDPGTPPPAPPPETYDPSAP